MLETTSVTLGHHPATRVDSTYLNSLRLEEAQVLSREEKNDPY